MSKQRFIIEVHGDLSPSRAFSYCKMVAWEGRISGNGTQHCYHTVFKDGTTVSCIKRGASERFVVAPKTPSVSKRSKSAAATGVSSK